MSEARQIKGKWLVKTHGDNAGKIFGYNEFLAKKPDLKPYDGPIDERGFAAGPIPRSSLDMDIAYVPRELVHQVEETVNVSSPQSEQIHKEEPKETLNDKILRLRSEGKSLSEIGAIVGKSKTAIHKKLKKLESKEGG